MLTLTIYLEVYREETCLKGKLHRASGFTTLPSSLSVSQIAVGMWADFSLKDLGEPFRMWYIHADYSKKQTKEHERLLRLYRRAKNRKMTHGILKAWKHLVSA